MNCHLVDWKLLLWFIYSYLNYQSAFPTPTPNPSLSQDIT